MSKASTFSAPKGIPDYVPPQSAEFVAVRDGLTRAARLAGYGHIELPIFEDTGLFARGVGESTDVVSKEMYTFADRGDRSVTLRPEGTAGVMRAVIEHSLDRGQLPVKVSYAGPFFRYERPQAGRYRQLQQVGVEAIGIDDPPRSTRRSSRSPTPDSGRWGGSTASASKSPLSVTTPAGRSTANCCRSFSLHSHSTRTRVDAPRSTRSACSTTSARMYAR